MTTKDDYQCTNVETPNCYMEEKIINDVTCTNSVENVTKARKTMVTVLMELFALGSRPKTVTTFHERSKSRFAKLMSTGIVRSSRISSHSPLKNRIVTSNRRRSASWR